MTVDLLVRIQHHPSRAEILPRLTEHLEGMRVEVIADPRPDSPRKAAWRSFLRCLAEPWEGTHLLVIQDDAMPGLGFAAAAPRAIAARPESIIAMFLAHSPKRTAREARAAYLARKRWVAMHPMDWVPTVATSYPRDEVDRFVSWADSSVGAGQTGDDSILGRYCKTHRVQAYATVPSLVEHPDDVASVVRHRSPHAPLRHALTFDEGLDQRTIDWSF